MRKTALPVHGSAADLCFRNRVQAGSGDAVEDLAEVEQAGPDGISDGFLPNAFPAGAGADLRRRTAQGVHEKAAGRLGSERVKASFFWSGKIFR